MERILIKAVYENGVLKPEKPLPLAEHQQVKVMVFIGPSRAELSHGLMQWTGSVEDLEYLAESPDILYPDLEDEGSP